MLFSESEYQIEELIISQGLRLRNRHPIQYGNKYVNIQIDYLIIAGTLDEIFLPVKQLEYVVGWRIILD